MTAPYKTAELPIDVGVVEYAIEADPGQCTASFPPHCSLADAEHAAEWIGALRPDVAGPRLLRRVDHGPWSVVASP